jgi:cation:H+ antiporter
LGNTFLGASLLELTTSLPELISSVTAVRIGLFDLVIGNIIGSNALNMVIFVFMDWIWTKPPLWSHLSPKNILIAGVVVVNMLLVALTWGKISEKRFRIKSWGTLLILFLSLGCYLVLYFLREKALK